MATAVLGSDDRSDSPIPDSPYSSLDSRQPTTSDLVLLIRQRVLETGAPDAMLNKLKEEGIEFIKDLEFI